MSRAASLVDLAEVGLPLFDEPNHPSQMKYEHAHTNRAAGGTLDELLR